MFEAMSSESTQVLVRKFRDGKRQYQVNMDLKATLIE